MKKETTVDRVLHYIGRKVRKDGDGNSVISRHHAEVAAKMAFEGGRQSVLDNLSDLEWEIQSNDLYSEDVATSVFGDYHVGKPLKEKNYGLSKPFSSIISYYNSMDEAIEAANDDYKKRMKEILKL